MALPKLLFYTHGLVDGGAERLWASLASAFKACGHEVIFAVDFEAEDNRGSLAPGIAVEVLGRNHMQAIRNLSRLLDRERPDVALAAVAGSNIKLVLADLLAATRTPIISSYHGFEEWRTGWMSWLAHRLLPLISARSGRVVAVSDELAKALVNDWGARPGNMEVLVNPVFVPEVGRLPTEAELKARDDVVLAAGRLVPEKDFVTLIRAFAQLERPRSRLVILGKGPERARLEAEARRLGVAGRVALPGFTAEPWQVYAKAKCLAVSSRTESFGNVIVEAMAHGLPAVATACAGPVTILGAGQHGRIVPIGDAAALARALDDVLERPGDPAPRGKRAREFSFASRLPDYAGLIRTVIDEAHHAAARTPLALSCLIL